MQLLGSKVGDEDGIVCVGVVPVVLVRVLVRVLTAHARSI